MNTNHKPATALPWATYCKTMLVGDKHWDSVGLISDADNAAYAVHTANAYPELVEALQTVCRQYENVRAAEGYESPSASVIFSRALLTKLGEA